MSVDRQFITGLPKAELHLHADMKAREITDLLHDGVKVSIASDDPAYFGGYVADNIAALAERANLTRHDVAELARNSLEISWLDEGRRQDLLARLDSYVQEAGV